MKSTLNKLKVGDRVLAQVIESMNQSELIVSFRGDLVRVKNESLNHIKKNDQILVRVVALSPLSFQIVNANARPQAATKINILA